MSSNPWITGWKPLKRQSRATCGSGDIVLHSNRRRRKTAGGVQVSYTLQVNIEQSCSDDVVAMALDKCRSRSAVAMESHENYVLRVSGRDEYFLGSYPLSQFKVHCQPHFHFHVIHSFVHC